jgi:hypothetical protein
VVSHFDVFGSPIKSWVFGKAYGTGVITHEGHTLIGHFIVPTPRKGKGGDDACWDDANLTGSKNKKNPYGRFSWYK